MADASRYGTDQTKGQSIRVPFGDSASVREEYGVGAYGIIPDGYDKTRITQAPAPGGK